jgi:hydroxyacyl-ACP dehydratase HTD2-like protein with hotdog domain
MEISSRGIIIRHPVFLPQQPIRVVKQPQCKEKVEDASTVESRAIGRFIVRRRRLNNSRPLMPQQGRMHLSREQAIVFRGTTTMGG